MLVVCSDKNELWCPHGIKNCKCEKYDAHEKEESEDMEYSCTDINADSRDCHLIRVPENDLELKVKKFVDMLSYGMSISEAAKNINCLGTTLEEFMNELAKQEYADVRFKVDSENEYW